MFIRIKPIANSSRKRVQICACTRVQDKVKQKVIKHVGIAENDSHLEELRKLAQVLKKKLQEEREGPSLFDLEEELPKTPAEPISTAAKGRSKEEHLVNIEHIKEESRVIDGFHDIFGTLFNQLGFQRILKGAHGEVLRDIVLARIASPTSKSATQQILAADFGRDIDLDRIYRMMDALILQKEEAQKKVFLASEQLCFGSVDLLFFDVTTLYFESTAEDELRAFGYSKDQKFHSTQVVLALATTARGLPIGYQLFPGNTADTSTLIACIDSWKRTLPIGRVRIVADRAMMSEKNLKALEEQQIEYVVAAKLRKQSESLRSQILACPKERAGAVLDQSVDHRRLIVTFCPQRAAKDAKDRERILAKMMKKIGKGKSAKKLISNAGYQKYLSTKGDAELFVDSEKIAQDAAWDGFHGIITNCKTEDAEELLSQYRRLWVIEESFRIQKHNLHLRPIYHFKAERIEAHILICYLAFALMRHLEVRVGIQKEHITMKEMRAELWRVQSSYVINTQTNKRYRMPSSTSVAARKLYQVMGIKRVQTMKAM